MKDEIIDTIGDANLLIFEVLLTVGENWLHHVAPINDHVYWRSGLLFTVRLSFCWIIIFVLFLSLFRCNYTKHAPPHTSSWEAGKTASLNVIFSVCLRSKLKSILFYFYTRLHLLSKIWQKISINSDFAAEIIGVFWKKIDTIKRFRKSFSLYNVSDDVFMVSTASIVWSCCNGFVRGTLYVINNGKLFDVFVNSDNAQFQVLPTPTGRQGWVQYLSIKIVFSNGIALHASASARTLKPRSHCRPTTRGQDPLLLVGQPFRPLLFAIEWWNRF